MNAEKCLEFSIQKIVWQQRTTAGILLICLRLGNDVVWDCPMFFLLEQVFLMCSFYFCPTPPFNGLFANGLASVSTKSCNHDCEPKLWKCPSGLGWALGTVRG